MTASAGDQLPLGKAPVPRGRVAALIAMVACACLALSACGGGSSSTNGGSTTGTGHAGGSLTVLELGGYAGAWPAGLDPATNTNGAADQDMMNSIYGQLFELTDGAKIRPDLATGHKFSNGGKTFELTLRRGVKFSDGTPLDAKAVLFNWKRDLANPCTCKPVLPPVTSLTAPDDHTVRISFKSPDGALVNQLLVANLNWIASPTALKKMGAQKFKLKPVGAGPFTVVSDALSNQLVLKKNPGYWDKGKPYLDKLTFKAAANDEAALETMQSGGAQAYVGMATPSLVDSFSKFTVTREPSTSPYNIQLNTAAPPFNNIKARQAIYYATDAKTIDDKLFHNQNPVVQSFTAPAGLFYSATVPGYPTYNPAKAKALVKQLGGLNVNFFTLRSPVNQNFMVALQQMWKQAGINASIHLYSLAGLIQQFNSKKWQAALQTAGAWDPAAGVGVGFRYLSQSPFSGVHDPKLDGMILGAQGSVNPAKRKQLYDAAGAYIAKQAYSPFLFPLANWNIAAKNVKGIGLTTAIPSIVVNTAPLWEEVTVR